MLVFYAFSWHMLTGIYKRSLAKTFQLRMMKTWAKPLVHTVNGLCFVFVYGGGDMYYDVVASEVFFLNAITVILIYVYLATMAVVGLIFLIIIIVSLLSCKLCKMCCRRRR